jgi:hypothetical protein
MQLWFLKVDLFDWVHEAPHVQVTIRLDLQRGSGLVVTTQASGKICLQNLTKKNKKHTTIHLSRLSVDTLELRTVVPLDGRLLTLGFQAIIRTILMWLIDWRLLRDAFPKKMSRWQDGWHCSKETQATCIYDYLSLDLMYTTRWHRLPVKLHGKYMLGSIIIFLCFLWIQLQWMRKRGAFERGCSVIVILGLSNFFVVCDFEVVIRWHRPTDLNNL